MARTFVLTTPPLHGNDVAAFQGELNHRLALWGVDRKLKGDGIWDVVSKRTAMSVGYGLGLNRAEIIADGVTPAVRSKVRHAGDKLDLRSHAERVRAKDRRDWVRRYTARYHDAGAGSSAAVEYATKMAGKGIVERPAGSNAGPYISDWERLSGYAPGVFWCLCFVNGCWVAGGWPASLLPWHGYCPALEGAARAGQHGLKWHSATSAPKKGWAALFTESGVAGHVEIVVADGTPLRTVGGNTSKGNGSPNNGGGVFAHNFASYHGLPLRGYAELPWSSL